MANNTITIKTEAYERLKKNKLPGDSFTDVILREVLEPLKTCGELEDYFAEHGVPKADPKLRSAMLAGRGRRSRRSLGK